MYTAPENTGTVKVSRRISSDRDVQAFDMRAEQAELEEALYAEMKDARQEMNIYMQYVAGDLQAVTSMRTYGYVTGGSSREGREDFIRKLKGA